MTTKTLQNKELQEHYDQIFAMYGTRGWARLQAQIDEMIASHNSVADLTTLEQLWFRKGQLDQMLWLQMHQATHEAAYNDLIAQQEGEDAPVSTGGIGKVLE
ncbi:MAG TPA: hypothetical protein VFO89_08470 [Thermoanaerobaculia bacterium]|nr:hypothetical protein [Thermoanaerobaculia bacterium]